MNNKNGMKLFILGNFIVFLGFGCFLNFQGVHLKTLGFPESFVGTLFGIQTMTTAIGALLCSFIVRILNPKKTLVIACFLLSIASIFMAIFKNSILLMLFAGISGFCFSAFYTLESPIIMSLSSKNKSLKYFSISFTSKMAAMMFGTLLGGFLSQYFMSTKHTLLLFGVISILISPIFLFLGDIQIENSKNNIFTDIGTFISSRNSFQYLLFSGLVSLGAGMIFPFFSIYIKYTLHVNNSLVGTIVTLSQLGIVIGGLLIPLIQSRFGKIETIVMCQGLSIPFLLGISLTKNIYLVGISFFMRSALMNMAQPALQNMSMEIVTPEQRTNYSGFLNLSNNFLRAIGTFVGGFIMTHINYDFPYFLTSTLYIIAVFRFWTVFRPKKAIEATQINI